MKSRRLLAWTIASLAVVLLAGRWLTSLYSDRLWFSALGAEEVWSARLFTTGALVLSAFLISTGFAFVNLYAVRRSVVSLVLPRRVGNLEIGEEVPASYLTRITILLSALLGALLSVQVKGWETALLAFVGRPFGESDPYFGADLGFFVYWLPFETAVHFWSIFVMTSVTLVVIGLYALTPSLRWDRGRLYVSAYVRRHFMLLGAVLLAEVAWSYRLGMYRLLAFGGETPGVFTMIDHRVVVPSMLLLAVVCLGAAIVVGWAGWTGQMRLAFFAVSTVLLLSLLSRTVAPLLARRSFDEAAAAAQEHRYIATRLSFTRRAFGVYQIHPETLGAGFAATGQVATGLAVWDGATLALAAERQRRVRVVGSDVSWQSTASGISALLVERSSEPGAAARDVWGVGRFEAVGADERGLPVRLPSSSRGRDDLVLTEPAVYDSAPSYSVLADSMRILSGVELLSTWSRLVHAWSLQNFRILFGDLPANRPTLVAHRDVRERLSILAPFFLQGSEVVPIVSSDSLYWVVELYSASSTYPLAQRLTVLGEDRGYFHHAATAVVHAASGRVRLVLDRSPDPVAASWAQSFPRLFVSASSVPASLQGALPPLVDGALAQAQAYAIAGFRGDSLEVRHLAVLDGADSAFTREPTHAAIPGIAGVSALWPLLDSLDRVRGVVVASSGVQRITTWLPVTSDGTRWGAVVDRIRSVDTTQHSSGAVRAPLRVLPVAGRPLFVQPTFQWRAGGVPSLLRVAVLASDSVHVANSLSDALGAAGAHAPSRSTSASELRARLDALYLRMRTALARGDWPEFGRAFDSLGVNLRTLAP